MNRNGHVFRSQGAGLRAQESAVGSQEPGRRSQARGTGRPFIALLLVAMVIGTGVAVYLAPGTHLRKAATSKPGPQQAVSSVSVPLFFEPNLGQTDPQVKFLARGSGYGLFLTADEAVLELRHSALSTQNMAFSFQPSALSMLPIQ